MDETTKEATRTVLSWIPKKLRPWIAILLIIIVTGIAILIVKRKYIDVNNDKGCNERTLKGSLIDRTNNQRLINVKIELENSSSSVESYTTPDGSFLLEGVSIPKSKIISLLITFKSGKVFHVKDIDLNNVVKYSIGDNCVTDLQTIYITPTETSEVALSGNSKSTKNNTYKRVKTFIVAGFKFKKIEDFLISLGFESNNKSPDYIITFSFSGQLEKIDDSNLYRYNGGLLKMIINDNECAVFSNLKIDPTSNVGNTRDYVLSVINQGIENLVLNHADECFEKLRDCL